MCVHCGCDEESNRHGNKDSITIGDVKKAMKVKAHREGGKGRNATGQEMKRMVARRRK